jgi:MFS family permease
VIDTSLMNVSISAVVRDLDTTVSGVQAAVAIEALVSAAFILIGSKVGDLFGRKRAYVAGLILYAAGALAMVVGQGLAAIIVFWAVIGGLGASLYLPAMQSLIHGNFEGKMQAKVYALVGASAAIAAAIGPLLGGFLTTLRSWRVGFLLEALIIAAVLSGSGAIRDVPYKGDRSVDLVGALFSIAGMGGLVLGVLAWQEGAESVAALLALGLAGIGALVYWLVRRKREGKPTLLDPSLFSSKLFSFGIAQGILQQIALGAILIALPIYLQLVLGYNALEAGLSLAPVSLTMFGVALLAGKRAGRRRPAGLIRTGFFLVAVATLILIPIVGLSFGLAFAGAVMLAALSIAFTDKSDSSTVLPPADKQHVADVLEDDAQVMSDAQLEELLAEQPEAIQDEIISINTDARHLALQVALLVTLVSALIGLVNAFRMVRLPDPQPASASVA